MNVFAAKLDWTVARSTAAVDRFAKN